MLRKMWKLNTIVCSALLALGVAAAIPATAKADYVTDEVNGVSYYDEESVSVKYCSNYYQGGGGYAYVSLSNSGDRVGNVKSSSKNLLAKKTYERYSISTNKNLDYTWDETKQEYVENETTTTTTTYGSAYISFFAKKAGSYKVTFDVIKEDGNVRCTKTIKVTTYGDSGNSPVKSIKYDGKDIYTYYPFTTKTSGKLAVKMSKNYKLVKIEIGKRNKKGEYVYKKAANNKKISLAKSAKYTYDTDYSEWVYNPLFPSTSIRITFQNKKTKETGTYTTSLATINKK
ncbi:MAG: hypothetical protein IJ711_12645 [Lachnospiraceae bacterium]|nr:hypothetical protein [Lachnospiraceae bacterium]